jgi:ribosomal subunit interface protein
MIKIEINAADYDLHEDLKTRIENGFGGLDEYMEALEHGDVILTWVGGANEQTKVHARVWGPGVEFTATDTDWKSVTAVDQTRDKLKTQIRREHGKKDSERGRRR